MQTDSYSSATATLNNKVDCLFRSNTNKAAEAPNGLRMPATTTSVSTTNLIHGRYHIIGNVTNDAVPYPHSLGETGPAMLSSG